MSACRDQRTLSVRMTDMQYRNLQHDLEITRFPITLYFQKPIHGIPIKIPLSRQRLDPYPDLNKIVSNVRQILRTPNATSLDAAVAQLDFLIEKLCEEIFLLSQQK